METQLSSDQIQQRRALEQQAALCADLEQEVAALKRELEEHRAGAAAAQAAALEEQREEVTAAVSAQERLQRQQQMGLRAVKRLANQALHRGWGCWQQQWAAAARQQRTMAAAGARLRRPMLVACFATWRQDWTEGVLAAQRDEHAAQSEREREAARRAAQEARRAAAATRISLEEVISDLEAEMRVFMTSIATKIPPKEPRYLVLHSISAQGVPDADAVGGADPYVRFVLLDQDGDDRDISREVACTSFKRKEFNPVWEGERLQFKLALGGARPPALRVEVWDKDFNKADDPIAKGEVTLDEGSEGTLSLKVPGVDGNEDVQALHFSYTLAVEEETIVLDAARAAEMSPSVGRVRKQAKVGKPGKSPKKAADPR